MKTLKNDPTLLEEYDFQKGIRGKYVEKFKKGTNIVVLDPEIMEYFPDSDSVNEALKLLTTIMKNYSHKK